SRRRQPPRHLIKSLRDAVVVFVAVHIGGEQTRKTEVRDARGKIVANELAQQMWRDARREVLVLQRSDEFLDGPILLPRGKVGGGPLANALEPVKDRQKRKEFLVHVGSAVRRMFDERESERLAQLFHRRAVDKLGAQFDGMVRKAPV